MFGVLFFSCLFFFSQLEFLFFPSIVLLLVFSTHFYAVIHCETVARDSCVLEQKSQTWPVTRVALSSLTDSKRIRHTNTKRIHTDTECIQPNTKRVRPNTKRIHTDMKRIRTNTKHIRTNTKCIQPHTRNASTQTQNASTQTRNVFSQINETK